MLAPSGGGDKPMQIILLRRGKSCAPVVTLGCGLPLFLGLLLGAVLAAGMFKAGSHFGRQQVNPLLAEINQQAALDLQQQQRAVETLRRELSANVDALSLRLGQLQAHTLRLDALGERLTQMARLDPGEFDFSRPPALGGPESGELASAMALPDLEQSLAELAAFLADREGKLQLVEEFLLNRNLAEQVLPSGRPLEDGWISSRYGRRSDPFNGRPEMHHGVDFAGRAGADILAVASGVVIFSGKRAGFGRLVEIDHGNGYVTRYAHNKENLVAVGDAVTRGHPVARLGSSGRSTGPHVHFEVLQDGKQVNPMSYIQAAR